MRLVVLIGVIAVMSGCTDLPTTPSNNGSRQMPVPPSVPADVIQARERTWVQAEGGRIFLDIASPEINVPWIYEIGGRAEPGMLQVEPNCTGEDRFGNVWSAERFVTVTQRGKLCEVVGNAYFDPGQVVTSFERVWWQWQHPGLPNLGMRVRISPSAPLSRSSVGRALG